MTRTIIKTFAYDAHWGGGFGWLVLPAPGGDRICALGSSERASATRERAVAAAKRWVARQPNLTIAA